LAEADGPVTTLPPGADLSVSTAGVAPAVLPATPAVAGGGPQTILAAVVPLGQPLPAAGAGNGGIVPVEGTAGPAAVGASDVRTRLAAVDAFLCALPPGGGARLRSEAGGPAATAAALGDTARALGSEEGRDTGAMAGPVTGNLAAVSPVLLGLLGAAWGWQAEERKALRLRRRRLGSGGIQE
jgi:hypothetical protein